MSEEMGARPRALGYEYGKFLEELKAGSPEARDPELMRHGQESDPEFEAAEDAADLRDHIMWLNGFRVHAVWEVTRAELRDADIGNLRNIAESVYDLDDVAAKSRTALIAEILASRHMYRWGP